MTREEAINEIKSWDFLEGKEIEAIHTLIPELRESDDERIMKDIVAAVEMHGDLTQGRKSEIYAYLEKQKDAFENGRQLGIMQEQARQELEWPDEKQKEQKPPVGFYVTLPDGEKYYAKEMRCNGMNVKVVEPKPAEWSEEDERMLSRCIKSVECSKQFADSETYKAAKDTEMNWLQNLSERFNIQPKQEWSENDKTIIEAACNALEIYGHTKLANMLKSLHPQSKQEWSEEDEKMWMDIKSHMIYGSFIPFDKIEWLEKRLKSLRPSWRPIEDEERLINTSISFLKDFADKGYENAVECIDWLKSKLNGNSCE